MKLNSFIAAYYSFLFVDQLIRLEKNPAVLNIKKLKHLLTIHLVISVIGDGDLPGYWIIWIILCLLVADFFKINSFWNTCSYQIVCHFFTQ
jgi:hypothetical protein